MFEYILSFVKGVFKIITLSLILLLLRIEKWYVKMITFATLRENIPKF